MSFLYINFRERRKRVLNTCVMCGDIVLNGDHVCKYCIEMLEKKEKDKEG